MADLLDVSPETIAQGKRFRRLRALLNFSQGKFAKELDYSRASINYWENANNGGLTPDGAIKAIEVSKRYGVICTIDWLLFGEGTPPYFADEVYIVNASAAPVSSSAKHEAEIALFKKHHPTHVIYPLELSNAVFPFIPGDLLGGTWMQTTQCPYKQKLLVLVEEGDRLSLCTIQHKKNQEFSKTDMQEKVKERVTLDKFVHITRWWRPYAEQQDHS